MPYLNTIRLFNLTLLPQLYECPPCQTFGAQTEFDLDLFSSSRTGTSTGTDACTQVDEKDVSRLKLKILSTTIVCRLTTISIVFSVFVLSFGTFGDQNECYIMKTR